MILYNTIQLILSKLNVRYSTKSIESAIKFKGQTFSFSSIKDILLYFSINSKCYKLPVNALFQLEYPFIAQIKEKKEEFIIIINVSEQCTEYYNSKNTKIKSSIADFEKIYTGFILIPLTDEYSCDPDYEYNIKNERRDFIMKYSSIIVVIACLILLSTQVYINYKEAFVSWLVLIILKITALIVVSQILKIEFGESNQFIRKVCKTSNCSHVLNSKASRIFSWLSMGDIGTVYFGFGIFILCIIPFISNPFPIFSLLFLINLCTLPYTLFSISYQRFFVKSWCPFCLSVMGILWLEFILGLTVSWTEYVLPVNTSIFFLFLFAGLITMLSWGYLKKLINSSIINNNHEDYVRIIKKDPELFMAFLSKNDNIPNIDLSSEITWGDSSANNNVIITISPHCPSCISMYHSVKKYMSLNPSNIKATLRLVTKDENDESWDNQVVDITLTTMAKDGQDKALMILESWFEMSRREIYKWKKMMNLEEFNTCKEAKERRKQYNTWFNSMGNKVAAPAIIYNYKIVPIYYTFKDVQFLLNYLLYEEDK